MIDFVGTPKFLRISLQVAMETMHFKLFPTQDLELTRHCFSGFHDVILAEGMN